MLTRIWFQPITAFIIALLLKPGVADAALYGKSGVHNSSPTVCFVGDAATTQRARVAQIKKQLSWFEEAANIRFKYEDTCTSTPKSNGDDYFSAEIRVVIPGTSWGSYANVYNELNPIPGKGCPVTSEVDTSWSHAPNQLKRERSCLFNLRLGDDNFASAGFGDPSGGSVPFLNHTLHEFGHALGLGHEHARYDVPKEWVLLFLQKIPSVGATNAENIYGRGYRSIEEVASATVNNLRKIPGYKTSQEASALKASAQSMVDNNGKTGTNFGGHEKAYLTPYDPKSVMHYTYPVILNDAPGNYANTGLSEYDRLAFHIFYPEDVRVAEIAGTTVIPQNTYLHLESVWKLRGADMNRGVARYFRWKLSEHGVVSAVEKLYRKMRVTGDYTLDVTYYDFLGRKYAFKTVVRVLTAKDFNRQIVVPFAARLPLL